MSRDTIIAKHINAAMSGRFQDTIEVGCPECDPGAWHDVSKVSPEYNHDLIFAYGIIPETGIAVKISCAYDTEMGFVLSDQVPKNIQISHWRVAKEKKPYMEMYANCQEEALDDKFGEFENKATILFQNFMDEFVPNSVLQSTNRLNELEIAGGWIQIEIFINRLRYYIENAYAARCTYENLLKKGKNNE